MMVELTIGEAMKRARKSKKITGKKLGEMTGYHPNIISKWETNMQMPNLRSVIDVADALGVSIDELVGYEVKKRK